MRHGKRNQRLSRPSEHREALLHGMMKSLVTAGQIETTLARAREAQRLADRLVTLGKSGSIHARRQAYRILQDRGLVKQLFGDIAPRFIDARGGYTRVLRLGYRRGDGATRAVLAFSRLPVGQLAAPTAKAGPAAKPTAAPQTPAPKATEESLAQPKGFFEGLRSLWRKKKGDGAS